MSEWQSVEHTSAYLARADRVPHRALGEALLIEEMPPDLRRVLDLGSGDGRLLDLVLCARPGARGVALDFSPPMIKRLSDRFRRSARVAVVAHDLDEALPPLGTFDAIVSSFAIHHLEDARKRTLYEEIWTILEPGGVFCNLEHVTPSSAAAHARFLHMMGLTAADEDPSNRLRDVETQLQWLRTSGFVDVDCYWKWLELALLVGRKPT